MEIIGLDFETHYDSDYSLSKMPTHQYIRDLRFRCLGCGFQFGLAGQPFYVEGAGAVQNTLDRIPWDRATVVCHNAAFDGSVLFERFGRRVPAFWLDTHLIARWAVAQGHLAPEQTVSLAALAPLVGMSKGDTRAAVDAGGQALADYGTQDVRIMMALLRKFLALRIPPEELAYMDMHIRMTTEPVLSLDHDLLERAAEQPPSQAAVHALLRKDANFVKVLDALGVPVEYKTTPKGKRKPALAKTDAFMQSLVAHEDPSIAQVADLRLSAQSNIVRTRAQRFLDIGEPLPVPLVYFGAHTGRASGTEINPQNLPRKGPLRAAVTVPEGYALVVGDSRQIEARLVGWQAGDAALMDTFESSDPYRMFAGRYMFGCDPADVTPEQRQIGKAGVLGLGFGQGVDGFIAHCRRNGLLLDRPTAQAAVDAYRTGFPRVPLWWKQLVREVQAAGSLTLPTGRKLLYPGLSWEPDDEGRQQMVYRRPLIFSKGRKGERQRGKLWHGALAENRTQAIARDVVFWQVWQFAREWAGRARVVWMTHDEAVVVARVEDADSARERLLRWLRTPPPWADGLRTDGEVHVARRYSEAK